MIKRVLTFVLHVQESVLLDFVCQNKVKTCQNCFHHKFPYKNEKNCILFCFFFEFLS